MNIVINRSFIKATIFTATFIAEVAIFIWAIATPPPGEVHPSVLKGMMILLVIPILYTFEDFINTVKDGSATLQKGDMVIKLEKKKHE